MELNLRARKKLPGLNIAAEMISFQNDKFGAHIEEIITEIYKFCDANKNMSFTELGRFLGKSDLIQLLQDTIFKRLGLKLSIRTDTECEGAIMPMFYNENHILLQSIFHGGVVSDQLPEQARLIEKMVGKKGTVDLEKAKVTGIFSEYVHECTMAFHTNYLYWGMSPAEQTAILLHELGHAFTYYEFSDRLETTNQVLANLSRVMRDKNANTEQRVYCLRELEQCFGLKEKTLDELADEKSYTIFGLKLFKRYIHFVQSQMPNEKYDQTSSEQLADNFATRFGYGRHLITGLDRIYKAIGSEEKNSFASKHPVLLWILSIFYIAVVAIYFILVITVAPAVAIFMLLATLLFTFVSGAGAGHMTYDVLKLRYKRIRQQFIDNIKNQNLSKETLRRCIDEIHFVDKIIEKTYDVRTPMEQISNFIFSMNGAARETLDLQYLLEDLAHNNLFLKSAEFKVLS